MATKTTTKKAKTSAKKGEKFDKATYMKWYESMLLMRKFEEKAGQLYIQQKIRGFCHLYIGQEALVAGAISATKPTDNYITAYRDHAHPIGLGMDPKYVMAELYGKETGCTKGKGGSMHMFSKELNFFGGHGIVGGQIPMGAGIAFADKYKGNDNVTLCYMGDGAVRQGAFHEALNMAMFWKLPVIFIIENNNYAMGTAVDRVSNVTNLNILYLDELTDWSLKNNMNPYFIDVWYPDFYSPSNLPESAKNLINKKFDIYLYNNTLPPSVISGIKGSLENMNSKKVNDFIWKKFQIKNNILDDSRNQSFSDTFKELNSVI